MVSKIWCNKGVQQDEKIWILKLVGVLVQDYANFIPRPYGDFMTTTNNAIVPANNSFALRSILDREKLNDTNFMDWYHNLLIVLTQDKKMYVLEGPIPEAGTQRNQGS
ncbi:hypothetical protein E3N88_09711 [Mikania micrantha]|uniref:Uncharacterized protein n=1 Tax=Mikania micrantha TaxID=192012 RepID=A0A5N6PMX0_9ASTR|nr:hypothetical protein E3N88_09711 [Mikania micrantha]